MPTATVLLSSVWNTPSLPAAPSESRSPAPEEELTWFALVVKPRHEKAADHILTTKGFETFLPLYRRLHQYGPRKREHQLPLFPGYLFCRFHPDDRFPVLSTSSVIQVAGAGRMPMPVEEREIESLRIAASKFALTPHPYLNVGETVCIAKGPLAGVEGIVLKIKNSFRLVLSVTMLQRSVAVELDPSQVCLA